MIAEAGHAALWVAAGLMGLMAVGLVAPARLGPAARPAALGAALATGLAFVALVHAFATLDLSVALVHAHSHADVPLAYRLTGTWANHEGSMLLWMLVLAGAGGLMALGPRDALTRASLGVLGLVGAGFMAFLLLASNPFRRLDPAPVEGLGLNPLLQDPGLAAHPPLLYLGYVGLSAAFALAVGAMLEGRVGPAFARRLRRWVLGAWVFLTLGVAVGSWWAYYELGWGGWWFWDPVENVALMPWLAATALVHSASVLERRDALRAWTLVLAVLGFVLAILGTFVVRSGLLTSVHAFAVDPGRGFFLLLLMALALIGAAVVYAWRLPGIASGRTFAPVSREGSLVLNNLLLMSVLGVVFTGTFYPTLLELASDIRLSVGEPYYNATTLPFALAIAVAAGVAPFLAWRRARPGALARVLAVPAVAAALGVVLAFWVFSVSGLMALLGVGAGAWLAAASVALLLRAGRAPHRWGAGLGHLGLALLILGATASTAGERVALAMLAPGEAVRMGGLTARLVAVEPAAGPNWTAVRGLIEVSAQGRPIALLQPERRHYARPRTETTEAGLHPLWWGDLHATLGAPDGLGRWQVEWKVKPFVRLIWWGAALMALGGVMAALGERRLPWPARQRRPALRPAAPPPLAQPA